MQSLILYLKVFPLKSPPTFFNLSPSFLAMSAFGCKGRLTNCRKIILPLFKYRHWLFQQLSFEKKPILPFFFSQADILKLPLDLFSFA